MYRLFILNIIVLVCLLAGGCSGISEDNRFIEVEATKVERTVLLEDFTGQNCINCPAAHRIIEALEQQYGNHFIAVSIHAGYFGIPATNKRYTGLMQDEGQAYCDRYGIEDFPAGVVDGRTPVLNADQWATAVYDEISQSSPVTIALTASLDSDTQKINIECDVKSGERLSGNLVVWVIESGIVARQEDATEGRINDYVHNNVFRSCVNGLDGTPVSLTVSETTTCQYFVDVRNTETEKWNIDNLAIVAFVTDGNGVVQAAQTNIETNK